MGTEVILVGMLSLSMLSHVIALLINIKVQRKRKNYTNNMPQLNRLTDEFCATEAENDSEISTETTKQDCFDKLKTISEYKENWNGYGAEPITEELIDECKFIINQLSVCPEIYPTANKSIQLEYHADNVYIEIEAFSDRYVLFYEVNGKCVDTELYSMSQAIDWWNVLTAMAKKMM